MSFCFFFCARKSKNNLQGLPCQYKFKLLAKMKIFRIPNAEKLGNFILTVITAFVSTFLMQSCMKY